MTECIDTQGSLNALGILFSVFFTAVLLYWRGEKRIHRRKIVFAVLVGFVLWMGSFAPYIYFCGPTHNPSSQNSIPMLGVVLLLAFMKDWKFAWAGTLVLVLTAHGLMYHHNELVFGSKGCGKGDYAGSECGEIHYWHSPLTGLYGVTEDVKSKGGCFSVESSVPAKS
ncbi:MAG: hypothetical protein KDD55_09800 [Bdellovibrionales bacterium]|nr:hypothetical protein [Bdellovibrionales bacterium]